MTSATDDLRLAADFPTAGYDDWRKLVDGVLKGAPFEKLVGKTYDGLKIDPIYRRAKGVTPIAGRAAAAPWQVMQRIDHPDTGKANALALHELATNSLKYGVLVGSEGRLEVTWNVMAKEDGSHHLALDWRESELSVRNSSDTAKRGLAAG